MLTKKKKKKEALHLTVFEKFEYPDFKFPYKFLVGIQFKTINTNKILLICKLFQSELMY